MSYPIRLFWNNVLLLKVYPISWQSGNIFKFIKLFEVKEMRTLITFILYIALVYAENMLRIYITFYNKTKRI